MNALLAELGKQLTGRIAATLLAPGALYVVAAVLAGVLGQAHALDLTVLHGWLGGVARRPDNTAAVLLVSVGFLAAGAATGLAAAGVGLLIRRSWSVTGRPALASARRTRWQRADRAVTGLIAELARDPGDERVRDRLRRAIAARDAIGLRPPSGPTWAGDRLAAVDERVHRAYGLDLAVLWPRLWLVLPDPARTELAAAQQRCAAATLLAGWGLLYLPMAGWWWPAAVITVLLCSVAAVRIRQAVAVYADLAESAVDLFGRDVLTRLGPDGSAPLTLQEATSLMRKDRDDRMKRDQ